MWDWSEAADVERMPRDSAEQLGVGIQGAATAQSRCDARLMELIGQFDAGAGWAWFEGVTSCAYWLAWACSMAQGTAREHLRVARALRSMPMVAARFAEGEFTYSKVRELTRLAGRVDEADLCELAAAQTASQLARTVRSYRAHPGTHLEQIDRRRLSWRDTDDGMVRLSVTLMPEEAAVLRGAVEAATDRRGDAPQDTAPPNPTHPGPTHPDPTHPGPTHPDPTHPDPTPTEGTTRPTADPVAGLCDVARGYLDSVPPTFTDDPHLVVVHIGLETLVAAATTATAQPAAVPTDVPAVAPTDVPAGTSQSPAELRATQAWIERGGPIEAATAARLSCDAQVVGMIVDHEGDVLAMGRTRRLASPSQRRALRVRDGSCRFPGCNQRRRLIPHHIVSWAQGGATDLDNLILLCQAHHTYVHEGGVLLTGRHGSWEFALPDSRIIATGEGPDPHEVDEVVRLAAWAAAQQPDRLFPAGAGEGFRLRECVQRLFDMELPAAA